MLAIDELEKYARIVRREVRDWYDFVEPQNTLFYLMCAEVSSRIYDRLQEDEIECIRIVLHIGQDGPYHDVVLSSGCIIDASVSQFEAAELKRHCLTKIPRGQYCYPATGLPDLKDTPPIAMVPCKGLPSYPVGPIVEVGRHDGNPMGNIYNGRFASLIEEVTCFSPGGMHPGGMDAVERALEEGDLEWRRTVAAAIWKSKKKRAIRLCVKALEDDDVQVRRHAKESLRRIAEGKLREYLATYSTGLKSDKRTIIEGILKRSEGL